jgi:hypothetical protein
MSTMLERRRNEVRYSRGLREVTPDMLPDLRRLIESYAFERNKSMPVGDAGTPIIELPSSSNAESPHCAKALGP